MTTDSEQIARLRISLDEIEPEIWRRVEVPIDLLRRNRLSAGTYVVPALSWRQATPKSKSPLSH